MNDHAVESAKDNDDVHVSDDVEDFVIAIDGGKEYGYERVFIPSSLIG